MLTVATDYFGLQQDNRLKVVIDDGIEFLKKAVKNGENLPFFWRKETSKTCLKINFHFQVNRTKLYYLM